MDLNHLVGSDLTITTVGDIDIAENPREGQQRVLRRLLTNPFDYVWHPEYGAGLARFLGQTMKAGEISGTIKLQMKLEQAVKQSPPPTVTVTLSKDNTVLASIQYIDADSGLTSNLTFPVE